MTESLHVTVIIPTYNRPSLLQRTLSAVLDQTYDRYEVVVVDDGSDSEQREFLEAFAGRNQKLRVIFQENQGPAAARNRGWETATGDVVAFTDDDCLPPTNWIERLVQGYQEHPEVAGVGSWIGPLESEIEGNVFARHHAFKNRQIYQIPNHPVKGGADLHVGGTGSMSYRRFVYDEFGGFDEGFPLAAGEDADLQSRVTNAGYELLFVPVKVDHIQEYSLRQFIDESVRRGRGLQHYNEKHGETRSTVRILLGAASAPLYGLSMAQKTRDVRLIGVGVLGRFLNRYGELLEKFQ